MNCVILSGNITKTIEPKYTNQNITVLSNVIAVKRNYKNQDGGYDTDFIELVAYRSQADYLVEYAKKGDKIEIKGRWQRNSYQTQDGNTRYKDVCIVEDVSIIYSKKEETHQKIETHRPYQQRETHRPYQETQSPYFDIDDKDLPF